jgi:hypothetical protein
MDTIKVLCVLLLMIYEVNYSTSGLIDYGMLEMAQDGG